VIDERHLDSPGEARSPCFWLPVRLPLLDRFSKIVGRTGFEPVTSSVSGMAIPPDLVAQGRVTAGKRGSAVVARRARAGYAWRRCHLVSHWLSVSEPAAPVAVDWPVVTQSGTTTTPPRVMQDRGSATVEVGTVCSDQRLIPLVVRPRLTGLRSRRDELPADDPG
jgi:hypothetical protein